MRFIPQRLEVRGQLNQIEDLLGLHLCGVVDGIMNRVSFPTLEDVPETDINYNPVPGFQDGKGKTGLERRGMRDLDTVPVADQDTAAEKIDLLVAFDIGPHRDPLVEAECHGGFPLLIDQFHSHDTGAARAVAVGLHTFRKGRIHFEYLNGVDAIGRSRIFGMGSLLLIRPGTDFRRGYRIIHGNTLFHIQQLPGGGFRFRRCPIDQLPHVPQILIGHAQGFSRGLHNALLEIDGPPAEVRHGGRVMADEQERHATVDHLPHHQHALGLEKDIAHSQGFIDDKDLGIDLRGDRKGQPDEHPAGVGLHGLMDEIADIGKGQDVIHFCIHLFPGIAHDGTAEIGVLQPRHFGIEADPQLQKGRHLSPDLQIAAGRRQYPGDDLEQGGFPRPILSDDPECLTFPDLKTHILQGVKIMMVAPAEGMEGFLETVYGAVVEFVDFGEIISANGNTIAVGRALATQFRTHDIRLHFHDHSVILPSQHIGKVRPQFQKDDRPKDKDDAGEDPEFECPAGIFPEPDPGNEAVAVTLGDVEDGIELHQGLILFRHHADIPENGGEPEAKLEKHRHHLADIPHEDDERGGNPGQAHQHDDHGEEIIEDLEIAQSGPVAIGEKGQKDDTDEEKVDEEGREDLDDGDHAHLEDDLFHQVTVLQDGAGGVTQALGKKEPGNDAGNQPEDEGIVPHRRRPEADLEDKPEQEDRDRRLHEGPEEAQIRAPIPGLDVPTRQGIDKTPASKQGDDKTQEKKTQIFDSVHCPLAAISTGAIILIHPLAIGAAPDMLNPSGVGKIPGNRRIKPLAKVHRLPPAQFPFDLVAVDGVSPVMTRSILHIGDEPFTGLRILSENTGHLFAERVHQKDVFPFVLAAHIVGSPKMAPFQNRPDGAVVVVHKEPVADIASVAVDGQRFFLFDVEDHQRDQFLGKLVGTIVVGAVGEGNRQAIGMPVGHYQAVRGGLGRRIGAVWIVRRILKEEPFIPQGPVDLIGADMMEKDVVPVFPEGPYRHQQGECPLDVGPDELARAADGTVHMRFGSEMYQRIDLMFFKNRRNCLKITDIGLFKRIPFAAPLFNDIGHIFRITGIGQLIQIHNLSRKIRFLKKIPYKIGADESGAARHHNVVQRSHVFPFLDP